MGPGKNGIRKIDSLVGPGENKGRDIVELTEEVKFRVGTTGFFKRGHRFTDSF